MIQPEQSSGSSRPAASLRALAAGWTLIAACVLSGCGSGAGSALNNAGSSNGAGSAAAVSNGPQLGYVWRASDHTLRPLLGIVGSTQIGESVTAPGEFTTGAGSALGSIGVLIGSNGAVSTMALPNGAVNPLNVSVSPGAKIRFAPSAASALVFSPGAPSAALLSGWPGTVSAHPVTFDSSVVDAAVSDKGTVAIAVGSSSGVTILAIGSSGASQQVARVGQVGGMSFVPGTDDLLVTDSAANTLVRLSSVSTSPAAMTLPTSGLLNSPGGVGVSADGAWAAVANTGAPNVIQLSLSGSSAPQAVSCSCQPSVAAPLAGGKSFRFTELSTGPLWVGDLSAAHPKLMFVPALP